MIVPISCSPVWVYRLLPHRVDGLAADEEVTSPGPNGRNDFVIRVITGDTRCRPWRDPRDLLVRMSPGSAIECKVSLPSTSSSSSRIQLRVATQRVGFSATMTASPFSDDCFLRPGPPPRVAAAVGPNCHGDLIPNGAGLGKALHSDRPPFVAIPSGSGSMRKGLQASDAVKHDRIQSRRTCRYVKVHEALEDRTGSGVDSVARSLAISAVAVTVRRWWIWRHRRPSCRAPSEPS